MSLGSLRKTKAKKVLGIDASTQSIAFCLFVDGKPQNWGKLKLVGSDIYDKMGDANQKMYALYKVLQPDYVAVEKAVFVKSPAVALQLASVFGSIMGVLVANGVKTIDFQPLTWQNYIGNRPLSRPEKAALKADNPGRSTSWYSNAGRKLRKQRTMDYMDKHFGIQIDDDDVGDSFGIALYAYEQLTKR